VTDPTARPGGIGLDLLEIARLERALQRHPGLAQRVFRDGELAYAATRSRPARHLAARFCAKEAVGKALGMEAWELRDVEVVSPVGGGVPALALHGTVARRARELGGAVRISLTHTDEQAGAVAIIDRDG
jgi:holo-[acyl-carrier protein] synthase